MHDYLLSAVLGIVEGLTEFLPVSSTAHLRISEWLLKIKLDDAYWKMYSIVIQLGAILSVVYYFRRRIVKFIRTFPHGEFGNRNVLNHPLTLTMVAFVVTAGPMYLLHDRVKAILERVDVMAWALLIGGIIMWVVDRVYTHPKVEHVEDMSIFQAIWIGAMQILSGVFPGTSRSMATIAAGQVVELSRSAALEFSFFLSIPTMMAATLYELKKAMFPGHDAGRHGIAAAMSTHQWIILAIGFVVSFIVALAVVAWFMHWVRRRGFVPFAVYRILLGGGLLVWLWKWGAGA